MNDNDTRIARRGDIIARALRDERDEWQHRTDDYWIARSSGAAGAPGDPERVTRWLSQALVMYVTHGNDPLKAQGMGVDADEAPLRFALAGRIAAYKLEEGRIMIARANSR